MILIRVGYSFYLELNKTQIRVWLFVLTLRFVIVGIFLPADLIRGGIRYQHPLPDSLLFRNADSCFLFFCRKNDISSSYNAVAKAVEAGSGCLALYWNYILLHLFASRLLVE